ncbi:TIGR03088 family PEP-CTERM/XrtA system glycosyltransferase [Rubrivivax albus]|uniref:TIGR03088 family PEP-CTERM/XrtA system glycosyltransferase n=1 Tax=Rubrivivax albus TaxID=2499835 RepID=A0A3S2URP6_9BURK|nr:TIGR03088 family PEP-CTERM/XrtA system glycosyltransferase [Rubrivivax albus]RVT53450.1 TIGR03088 family PEP-CTERM/XrtA system glycosyltransferase [Rubrivivax albus]
MSKPAPPLVAHILHRFDTGGLENGVVNLINHLPSQAFRHVVIALTEVTDFRHRLRRPDVDCIALHKPPGQGFKVYPQLWRLMRRLRPAIVHTRNLAALEMQPAAWAAGVPVRIHGEHGRDVEDLDGSSVRHQRIRRLYSPFVHRYVALSQDLAGYLSGRVGIAPGRIEQIYNGVNADRFHPRTADDALPEGWPFAGDHFVVGTVGRMQTVKHQTLLARAFVRALALAPDLRPRLRLALVGDGPLRAACTQLLQETGAADLAWLPGERSDVPALMRRLNAFVLPSLGEGISNTILEAMASGLPVLATAVGGNPELVTEGVTGHIVPSDDVEALAAALVALARDPERAAEMGRAGRADVERRFSLQAMVGAYQQLYASTMPGRWRETR